MAKLLEYPFTKKSIASLRRGDEVSLTGVVYTARDQAHKRLVALIERGKTLPFDLRNQIIYYCGPNPAAPGRAIGSCGPTTSQRMDGFTPVLLEYGLMGMIGKGERSADVVAAIKNIKGYILSPMPGAEHYYRNM
jgi:Tartrate dehydratase beta subunit/Fumarate hydratase class I, C-terminal domain